MPSALTLFKRTVLLALITLTAAGSVSAEPEMASLTLSEQELKAYLSGAGFGMAKAAELNGYPGPKHVLELSKELQLSPSQQQATEKLYQQMHEQAMLVGKKLVELESNLAASFQSRKINASSLKSQLQELADTKSELRYIHLFAHLQEAEVLTPGQTLLYNQLRGHNTSAINHKH